MTDLEQHLIERSSKAGRIIDRLEQRSKSFSQWRLMTFLAVSIIAAIIGYLGGQTPGWSVFLIGMLPFFVLVAIHQRIDNALKRWKTWQQIASEDMARLRLDWDAIPLSDIKEPVPDHPFSSDMTLCGSRSLTHLIDTSVSISGSERLGYWLLEPDLDTSTIKLRQKLVHDLADIPYTTQKLRWLARMQAESAKGRWKTKGLLDWLKRNKHHRLDNILLILLTLSSVTAIGFLGWVILGTGGWWILSFITYVIVYGLNGSHVKHLSDESSDLYESLGRFSPLFRFLAKRIPSFSTTVIELTAPYRDRAHGPLSSMKRLRRIAFAAGLSRNEVMNIILNAILPWNMIFTWLLEREKVQLRTRLPEWLDRWYTLEAATSLAQLAVLNDDHTWPEPVDWPQWYAEDVSHPLIHKPVRVYNTHRFERIGMLGLITGSNMAGKSTFLRSVGLNTILANAGGPVIAKSFKWQPMRVFSSMKITDSVTEGYSYFFAEVRRLKMLFDSLASKNEPPLLFLIDEIFKGTNTKERLIGSRGYIRSLTTGFGFGLVATHDLELIRLSEESDSVQNLHFEETFTNGNMHFTYRLLSGPCTSTNALHIMRQAGLPIEG